MSTVGINATALAGLVIVIWVIVYGVLVAGFRIWRDDGRLRLADMLRRQGSTPQQAFDLCSYEAAIAVRRCMTCAHKVQCDEWSGAKRGTASFCPNADFIARVTARR